MPTAHTAQAAGFNPDNTETRFDSFGLALNAPDWSIKPPRPTSAAGAPLMPSSARPKTR